MREGPGGSLPLKNFSLGVLIKIRIGKNINFQKIISSPYNGKKSR
jgi:hypothetical protein